MKDSNYFKINPNGLSQANTMTAYLGGSLLQTVVDNPITSYRQLVIQYSKDSKGNMISPNIASKDVKSTFRRHPISASLSGLAPRLFGVGFKRIPKFGFLLGISYFMSNDGDVGLVSATGASILSAPFINPIRMIEKQQRSEFRISGRSKPILEILRESRLKNYKPLFRGTIPLMGHSLASATTGLVGQPKIQKYISKNLGNETNLSQFTSNLIASCLVSPIYVLMTNPMSRLEVIMQTTSIRGKSIPVKDALTEFYRDTKQFGFKGLFRGQGLGIVKAICSLTLFHQGRLWSTQYLKYRNNKLYLNN